MNTKFSFAIPIALLALLMTSSTRATTVTSAPAPVGEPLSADFQVTVEKSNVPVYIARVYSLPPEQRVPLQKEIFSETTTASFASFGMDGPVQVTITCKDDVASAKVLPTSYGIAATVKAKTITFRVDKPGQMTVEIKGNWVNSLHLFANPPETDVPDPQDPNVIYFGPGIHNVEGVVVDSGKTVYVADGAIVYGHAVKGGPWGAVMQLNSSNVTLRGRGIVDGSLCPDHWPTFSAKDARNVKVEGVIVRDSCEFSLPFRGAQNVKVDNVKILGWRGNSDGIDLIGCKHVEISNCFLRTFDDLIVGKSDTGTGELSDVTVKHCVLWNEFAHALSLGNELMFPVTNVSFSDCDVIHDKGRETVLRVYNIESGAVKNVTFDNIRVEEARKLMGVWLGKNAWSKQKDTGHVDDVVFSNITSTVPVLPGPYVDLAGSDDTHVVDRVLLQNVKVGGKPLTSEEVKQNAFVKEVRITP